MFKLIRSSKKSGNKSWKPHNHHWTDVIANTTCRPSYYILVFWFLYAIFFVAHCHITICVGIGTYHSVSLHTKFYGAQKSKSVCKIHESWLFFKSTDSHFINRDERRPRKWNHNFFYFDYNTCFWHAPQITYINEFGFLNEM